MINLNTQIVRGEVKYIEPLLGYHTMDESGFPTPETPVAGISAETVKARIDAGDSVVILDTRPQSSYTEWHITGETVESINIPYTEFLGDEIDDEIRRQLPRGEELIVSCAKGISSEYVASRLQDEGYDAVHIEDGMNGWARIYEAATVDGYTGSGVVIQYHRPSSGCLCYFVYDDGEAAVIDPLRQFSDRYLADAAEYGVDLKYAFDTHIHADHISGLRALVDAGVEGVLPEASAARGVTYTDSVTLATDGDTFEVGETTIQAIATPGHTSGMTAYYIDEAFLVTGDGLFLESVARPDLEAGADGAERAARQLYDTLHERILPLPDETVIGGGHVSATARPGSDGTFTGALGELQDRMTALSLSKSEFVELILADMPPRPANYETIIETNLGQQAVDDEEAFELELGPNNCAASTTSLAGD